MLSLKLKHGVMLFDEIDSDLILGTSWRSKERYYTAYAHCTAPSMVGVLAHRMILKPPKGIMVDHINGNGLDNRRCNLRLANNSQNCCNARDRKDRSLLYRGVKLNKDGKFHARISIDGKLRHIGTFNTAEMAARAFDNVAVSIRGEFARLNFPTKLLC